MKRLSAALLCLCFLLLSACGKNAEPVKEPTPQSSTSQTGTVPDPSPVEGRELLCTVGSEEEALSVGSLYGIELVEFTGHVAVYHTEEDVSAVIKRGEANGWPELSVNRRGTIF